LDISDELSNLIYKKIQQKKIDFGKNTILTSVPLHQKRQFFRGFNQSEVIAKKLAEKLKLRYIPDLLVRLIKNAFKFNNKYRLKDKNKKIVIFDDVWTTGSTIKEMAKVLKRKGIKTVIGLTITKR